ncbi:MAG TPA: glycoside hydrolase family 66 protein [Anaerolineae bacterium]|nr:glycoside hydrolase family 66 protein [Anaerolineae bacterium]
MRRTVLSLTVVCSILLSLIPLPTLALSRVDRSRVGVPPSTGTLINRVFTDKARYTPGAQATISAVLKNNTGSTWNGNLNLTVTHLESTVHTASQAVNISAGAVQTKTFTWTTPITDFQGYQVQMAAGTTDYNASAIDVSSTWTRYPRYGYVHAFTSGQTQAQSQDKIRLLSENYHIDAVQFYDWMWRHEQVISRTNQVLNNPWYDWAGNPIAYPVIQDLITATHSYSMTAMPYFMIYAGLQGYEQISGVNPQWGLFADTTHTNQRVFDFGDNNGNTNLWIFNPANPNWQNHLFRQYDDAIKTLDFDGIHLDQMGNYWGGPYYDYWGNSVDLGNSFSALLNNAKEHVNAFAYHTPGAAGQNALTFNMVNGGVNAWGVNDVLNSSLDFNYSEIWENSITYKQIYDFVRTSRLNSNGKALVLAAYMNYEENTGTRYEAESATLNGVGTNTNHTGYTGSGFVDQFGESGDYVQFSISVPEDGKYALVFRYANDTGSTNTRSVYVDGVDKAQLKFLDQANWDTWARDAYYVADLTSGAHTVKLARDANDSGFINLDSLTLGTFDEDSVRLANAAFAASGATHIEMGEGDQMLGHPYFPNSSKQMRNSLKTAMKDTYDFITAYENLLFDPGIGYGDSGAQWINITGETLSGDGSGGTIWTMSKRDASYDLVHLINLVGNDNDWRDEANTPTTKNNLAVKYYIGPDASVSGVYVASPDIDHGATNSLSYSTGTDSTGRYVSFTVPSLKYWDMVYIKRTFAIPGSDRYEAESAVKTAVSTNTNHTGYTGSGFVDGFASQGDGVSFTINAPTEDDYYLKFRYANDTGSTATRDIYVDGNFAGRVYMKDLANWDTWGNGILTTRLKPGLHHVVMYYGASNANAINLDNLEVKKTYVWTFNGKIDRLPEGFYLTTRVGVSGYVHWGTNNWTGVTDTWFVQNGSSNGGEDYEATIGPFSGDTEINFTFAWDDNGDGTIDRWEGQDFSIGANMPTNTYYNVEGISGNNYAFAQFDARGGLFDFMTPLGIWSGIKVDGSVGSQGAQVNLYKSTGGVKVGSTYYWLNDPAYWTYSQTYVTDTTTIKTTATHKTEPIKVTSYGFVPKNITFPNDTGGQPVRGMVVQRMTVENTSGSQKTVSVLYYQDMNINGADAQDSVTWKSTEGALYFHDGGDAGSGRTRTLDFGLVMTTTPPITLGHKEFQITDAAYLSQTVTLNASSSRNFDVLLVGATAGSTGQNLYDSHIKPAVNWFKGSNPGSLQTTTESFWTNLLNSTATTFETPDATYNNLYKRSLLTTYLYFDGEKGGMGAGSFNGAYFYNWPRDAVYGAATLDRAGIHDIPEKLYDWLWNTAERDKVGNDIGGDGVYHRFWYQKYTMDGQREWVNPQVDETAIIPWGAWYHYQMTGNTTFRDTYDDLVREAADVASTENPHECMNYDGTLKLMYAQNIWEDKWGYFLYSNANIVAGLRDGAAYMDAVGDTTWRNTFNTRKTDFTWGITNSLYNATTLRYDHGRYVKKVGYCTNSGLELNRDVSADVDMLGLVTPWNVLPVTDTKVISTVLHVEPALTDFSETKMGYGGVLRYRADQEELYGSDYRDHGDAYYDGGPWFMATDWMSEYYLEWADTISGTAKTDTAKTYLDYITRYVGDLGIGAEQIDENKPDTTFALETAWANVWESNGKFVDNMLAFVDYQYIAPSNAITVTPKLPTAWNYLGSKIQVKNGNLYVKVTKGTNQRLIDLDNNSTNNLSVEVYIQTDKSPSSVTGTSLNWSYSAQTGRVKLYGTLNASTTSDITINY